MTEEWEEEEAERVPMLARSDDQLRLSETDSEAELISPGMSNSASVTTELLVRS